MKILKVIFGIDDSSLPCTINSFFTAIKSHPSLAIRLLSNCTQLEELARVFDSVSATDGLFHGCGGAIDGWLCSTVQPIDRDIVNKRCHFSGHCQHFALNCQATCDDKLWFICFAVAAPRQTNDERAINKSVKPCHWIDSLQNAPFFLAGDNVCVLSDQLLIPFSGNSVTESQQTCNVFVSNAHLDGDVLWLFDKKVANFLEESQKWDTKDIMRARLSSVRRQAWQLYSMSKRGRPL